MSHTYPKMKQKRRTQQCQGDQIDMQFLSKYLKKKFKPFKNVKCAEMNFARYRCHWGPNKNIRDSLRTEGTCGISHDSCKLDRRRHRLEPWIGRRWKPELQSQTRGWASLCRIPAKQNKWRFALRNSDVWHLRAGTCSTCTSVPKTNTIPVADLNELCCRLCLLDSNPAIKKSNDFRLQSVSHSF